MIVFFCLLVFFNLNIINIYYLYNSCLCIGHYRDLLTVQGTVVLTETLIMPEPQARAILVLNSILLS